MHRHSKSVCGILQTHQIRLHKIQRGASPRQFWPRGLIIDFLTTNCQPLTLDGQSRALMMRIIAQFIERKLSIFH